MENTHIEWADHTFNPWIGCTQVSPGCAHCYALTLNKRWAGGKNWGKGAPRKRTSEANWKQVLKWNRDAQHAEEQAFGKVGDYRRPRVFCASLADWLDDEVEIEWLADLLKLIHDTPNLNWLLLTKRPENWKQRMCSALVYLGAYEASGTVEWLIAWLEGSSPNNVWIGTTVENQAMADQRIPQLLAIPAKVRFLSCEPLLEKVDLENVTTFRGSITTEKVHALRGLRSRFDVGAHMEVSPDHEPKVHWVICGGESGPGARPMHPDWARSLRDQCAAAGVPFFFKQWGEWEPRFSLAKCVMGEGADQTVIEKGDFTAWAKVGKRGAGRLLDGREWNEVPK